MADRGPIKGDSFRPCTDRVLAPTLSTSDLVKDGKLNKRNKRNN